VSIRDNDQTKDIATPAVIVAAIRSGGTFLTHCLSNHTQIFCDRGEPLHHLSVWTRTLKRDRRKILAVLLNQSGYRVSMCRLTYIQAFEADIWEWLIKQQPRVIWLYRENVLRQAISVHLNQLTRREQTLKRPAHTFKAARPVSVEIKPALFLKYCRGLAEQNRQAGERLQALKASTIITYDELVGGEGATASQLAHAPTVRLCQFLEVRYEPLACDLMRVNPYPLSQLITNWAEVEKAVSQSEFARFLEAE